MNTARRNTRVAGTLLAAVGTALMIISAPALASPERAEPPDPPGNNGTVKIDDTDFGDIPRNHPHVGCTFQVDFYNFDEGVGDATVTFTMIAPTADVGLSVAGDLTPDIGEDPADGTLDASVTYVLTFDGEPHPQQGYHVKLLVNAPGSIGNETKSKVFWVECELPTTSTTSTTETSTTETSTTETSTTETSTTETSTTETTSETTETSTSGTTSTTAPTTSQTTETTTSETTGTTVPSSTLPTTSETTESTTSQTTETTVPSSTLPTTAASTSPGESTSPPTSVAPSTSQSPAGPGAPTDFQAGLPGQQPTAATPGGAARSPWAIAGFFGGLAMAASGVTVLVRRPAGNAL